jgi:acyl carrier protein
MSDFSEAGLKLLTAFADSLQVDVDLITENLAYNSIPEWDSVAHMSLIAQIEESFDIMLDTNDVIDMSSVAKAREILRKYDVNI